MKGSRQVPPRTDAGTMEQWRTIQGLQHRMNFIIQNKLGVGRIAAERRQLGCEAAEMELDPLVPHTALTRRIHPGSSEQRSVCVALRSSQSSPATSQTLLDIWRKSVT